MKNKLKKTGKFLSLLIPLIVAILISFAVFAMMELVYIDMYALAGLYQHYIIGNPNVTIQNLLTNIPVLPEKLISNMTFLSFAFWIICYVIWYDHLIRNHKTGRKKIFSFKNIMIIVVAAIGLQLIVTGLCELLIPYFKILQQDSEMLTDIINKASFPIVLLGTVILGPIAEELIFRGVLLTKARRFTGFAVANFVQALLFAIYHFNLLQGLYAFVLGLVMGYIVYKYKTVIASMIFHIIFNGCNFLMVAPPRQVFFIGYIAVGFILAVFAIKQIKKVNAVPSDSVPELEGFAN